MAGAPRLLVVAVLLTACAAGAPAREPTATPQGPHPVAPPPDPTPLIPTATAVRIGAQQGRYLAHQQVTIHNDYAGLPPLQQLGFQSWFWVTVRDSSDAAGRLAAVFVIDSVVADSATALPPTFNLAAAAGLRVEGWLAPSGELQDVTFSDSTVAQNLGRLLGWFRRFFPYVPAEGFRPSGTWTDSLASTEPGLGATINRRAWLETQALGWEFRDSVSVLRLAVTEAYEFSGTGEGGGQPISLRGTGRRTGTDFLTAGGEYLGGTSSDSAAMDITLPLQGITIPQRQIGSLTITRLP